MPDRSRPRNWILMCAVSLGSLCFSIAGANPMFAQERRSLNDPEYMHEVARRVDSLLIATYVLPEEAERYATEFRRR